MLVAPLDVHDVGRLFADALVCDRERVQPLSHLVHEKTGGNPSSSSSSSPRCRTESSSRSIRPIAVGSGTCPHPREELYGQHRRSDGRSARRAIAATRDALKELACLGNSAPA